MYTQFFGNYLLNKQVITSEQLLNALDAQSQIHVKLGVLAIHEGFMTASEVERVFICQTHEDKRFGELAVREGYLTDEQVAFLLDKQVPDYIILGQTLVDQNVLTPTQLENLVTDYKCEYEFFELDINEKQHEMVKHLLQDMDLSAFPGLEDYMVDYIQLLFNDLIRFIGDDFTPLNFLKMPDIPTNYCVSQSLMGPDFGIASALNMDEETAISFATRYAKEEFTEFDEYVRASMEDFLNLNNGLFVVNVSNERSIEIALQPPEIADNCIFSPGKITYIFPILYPFGLVHFICSFLPV